jgi:hypothetical protein
MQAYGRSQFADDFAAKAADSDYSRYPLLRSASQYDIRAAAEALWALALRNNLDVTELNERMVITAMLAKVQRWDDEGELVSVEFEEYWDATDEQGFSSGLMEEIKKALVRNFLEKQKTEHIVVNNANGIWLFRKDYLWMKGA